MSRASDRRTPARGLRRLSGSTGGQSTVELALVLPLLLFLLLGLVEAARAFDVVHELKGIGREGANLASRGTQLDTVVSTLPAMLA